MHYAIADIHGCFDDFIQLINKIESKDSQAEFIILGDIIDRGPKVWEMLAWARQNVSSTGKYQMLMGNHEELAIEWYENSFLPWYKNRNKRSTDLPKSSFDFAELVRANCMSNINKLEDIISFFEKQPLYKHLIIDEKEYILAHAWAPQPTKMQEIINGRTISEVEKSVFLWDRRAGMEYGHGEFVLIYGHTPTLDAQLSGCANIYRTKFTVDIDCGCVHMSGRLAAFCIESGKAIYCHT